MKETSQHVIRTDTSGCVAHTLLLCCRCKWCISPAATPVSNDQSIGAASYVSTTIARFPTSSWSSAGHGKLNSVMTILLICNYAVHTFFLLCVVCSDISPCIYGFCYLFFTSSDGIFYFQNNNMISPLNQASVALPGMNTAQVGSSHLFAFVLL